jgi:hypothetical protein
MQQTINDIFDKPPSIYILGRLHDPLVYGKEFGAAGFSPEKEYSNICIFEERGFYYVALTGKYSKKIGNAVLIGAFSDRESLETTMTPEGLSKLIESFNSEKIPGQNIIDDKERDTFNRQIFSALLTF